MRTPILGAAGLAASLFLLGCGSDPTVESDGAVSSERAELTTENMLIALGNDDYTEFSRDFSPELKSILSKPYVEELDRRLEKTSGEWRSLGEATRVQDAPDMLQYKMDATFEREHVTVWIWYQPGSELTEGVWFDSPGLQAWGDEAGDGS